MGVPPVAESIDLRQWNRARIVRSDTPTHPQALACFYKMFTFSTLRVQKCSLFYVQKDAEAVIRAF